MMRLFKNKYRIESPRLRLWDYSIDCSYFITICTYKKEHILGELTKTENGQHIIWTPTVAGLVAQKCWNDISLHYPFAYIDEFTVMPNHLHGIIIIDHSKKADIYRSGYHNLSLKFLSDHENTWQKNSFGPQKNNLPSVMGGFKASITRKARLYQPGFGWQARYYDRIIRNEEEMMKIKKYIRENRNNWFSSMENSPGLYM